MDCLRKKDFTESELDNGVVILPRFPGVVARIKKENKIVSVIVEGVETRLTNSKLAHHYDQDFILHGVFSSRDYDNASFYVYDLEEFGGVKYAKESWESRQDRLKELELFTPFVHVKHRVAYNAESLQIATQWADGLQHSVGSELFSVKEKKMAVSFLDSNPGEALFLKEGYTEGVVKAYRNGECTTLEFIQDDDSFWLDVATPNMKDESFLCRQGLLPAMVSAKDRRLSESEVIDEGRFIVSRVRRESPQYYEVAFGFNAYKDLNGIWGLSESAATEKNTEGLLMTWLPNTSPYYMRKVSTIKRKKEISSLPDWQRPTVESISSVCDSVEDKSVYERFKPRFRESLTGDRWDVTIIKAGVSLNGNYWPPDVLEKSAQIFEGSPVNLFELVKNDPDHLSQGMRAQLKAHPVMHTSGWFENVHWDDETESLKADMVLTEDCKDLKSKLLTAQKHGQQDFLGLSVDVFGLWHETVVEGRKVRQIDEIIDTEAWVDIVGNPAAGGKIHKALESKDDGLSEAVNIKLNKAGFSQAKRLIRQGNVNHDSPWSFTAADGNKLLGRDKKDFNKFSLYHLGQREGVDTSTKKAWAFAYGKDGVIFRSGVIAIKQRAAQFKYLDVEKAADRLLSMIGVKDNKSNNNNSDGNSSNSDVNGSNNNHSNHNGSSVGNTENQNIESQRSEEMETIQENQHIESIFAALLLSTGFFSKERVDQIMEKLNPVILGNAITASVTVESLMEAISKAVGDDIKIPTFEEQIKGLSDEKVAELREELFESEEIKEEDETKIKESEERIEILESRLNQEVTKNNALRLLSESELPQTSQDRLYKAFCEQVADEKQIKSAISGEQKYIKELFESTSHVTDVSAEDEEDSNDENLQSVMAILKPGS